MSSVLCSYYSKSSAAGPTGSDCGKSSPSSYSTPQSGQRQCPQPGQHSAMFGCVQATPCKNVPRYARKSGWGEPSSARMRVRCSSCGGFVPRLRRGFLRGRVCMTVTWAAPRAIQRHQPRCQCPEHRCES